MFVNMIFIYIHKIFNKYRLSGMRQIFPIFAVELLSGYSLVISTLMVIFLFSYKPPRKNRVFNTFFAFNPER